MRMVPITISSRCFYLHYVKLASESETVRDFGEKLIAGELTECAAKLLPESLFTISPRVGAGSGVITLPCASR